MAKHKGLGRGLDALIPTEEEQKQQEHVITAAADDTEGQNRDMVRMLRITEIEPNRSQPRKNFDKDKLQELADSIKSKGLLEPIIVTDEGDHYEIIAGERRWRASRLAGLREIPAVVKHYEPLEKVEVSLIENIQRENLDPIEEAAAYRRLTEEYHMTQEELAGRLSRSRASITNSMRLLKLNDHVQQMVADGRLSTGHAKVLLGLNDQSLQEAAAQKVIDNALSVRDTEKLVHQLNTQSGKKQKTKEKDKSVELIFRDLTARLNSSLGMKVSIHSSNGKTGKLEISFCSEEDLEKISELLLQ